jgi:hypothetical protein
MKQILLCVLVGLCVITMCNVAVIADVSVPVGQQPAVDILSQLQVAAMVKRQNPAATVTVIPSVIGEARDYEVTATSLVPLSDGGEVAVTCTSLVDANTGAITSTTTQLRKNGVTIKELENELAVVVNNDIVLLTTAQNKEVVRAKCCVDAVKPLLSTEAMQHPVLSTRASFVMQVTKNHALSYTKLVLESDYYEFITVESSDLTPYLADTTVVKIADQKNIPQFVEYAKQVLKAEAQETIKTLELKKSTTDVSEIPALITYMEEDHWDVQAGQTSRYQQFVTPTDSVIKTLSAGKSTKELYELAVDWVWVSDPTLHGTAEKWMLPAEFLSATPGYHTNPVSGVAASDCSEQANTLVSLLRASGVAADDVRVVLGEVDFDGTIGGHAWVEIKDQGNWLVLDPTCGPYYDDATHALKNRNGVSYEYWKYHPYPVKEVWAYYNDVYFTDEQSEVAKGWALPYQVVLGEGLFAGLLVEDSWNSLVLVGVVVAAGCFVALLVFWQRRAPGNKNQP